MNSTKVKEIKASYESHFGRKLAFLGTVTVLLVILAVFSLGIGAVNFSFMETSRALVGGGSRMARTIIWNIRAPRVLTAIL
ncbi:MAG: iron chelate uptake ABC transporter family permease subunit, partial [Candidatus Aenigmatarchaeota archaeon]